MGKISEEQKKVYNIILRANKAAEERARAGVSAEEVDKVAREISLPKQVMASTSSTEPNTALVSVCMKHPTSGLAINRS